MYLTEEDVREIAAYTRIALVDGEVTDLKSDLNAIIETLKPITQYDLSGVEPTFHPIDGLSNVMREDVIKPSMLRETALALATSTENGQYRIPTILGEGSNR
ncbi:MAG: Asp-tRNA(Asn)/Glu-tRNA(Gln) amidotransferase subunit GatC [Coriobacteriia bacterium]|nr:Asp-tRNA(Asn)/Glu-tRNA(Gln) amidotransferase subunit GatC [Coriobacteriia bacterium]MCL2750407.1 Asp-tRNA(Asn)/Glu-tRNA(Gln) amidotransferase subunit GatC [Coriobacteriia bacterium]